MIICCVVNAVLGRYLNGYTVKKRLWYIAVATFSVLCLCGFCALARVGYVLPFFISAFSCLLFIPVAMAKPNNKDSVEAKELARFIDKNIYGNNTNKDGVSYDKKDCLQEENVFIEKEDANLYDNEFSVRELNEKKRRDLTTAKDFELDFQHVKNVISRLDYYDLKDCDKRQVKELENALLLAERGDFNLDVKSRINEGLGALLKIMSKHGI